jgi:DNA-binding MarR family transcriptional regulator
MAFRREATVAQLTQRAARLMGQLFSERVAALGVAPAQFSVLLELSNEDGLTQRELVERLDVEQGTATRTLQRMVRDGLLTRAAHEQDARASRWRLTARARRVLAPARAAAQETHRALLAGLSTREQDTLVKLLERVISNAHDRRLSVKAR